MMPDYKLSPLMSQVVVQIKRGCIIVFIGVLSLLLWGGINYLALRYEARFDLTENKQHTLTEETKSILKELKKEISITVFYVGIAPKYLEDLLKEYARISLGKIKTEIIDPLVDIGYAAQFGHVIKGSQHKAIVQCGPERRDIDFTEYPLSEQSLSNAIIKITRKPLMIYFLTGHGEYDIEDKEGHGLSTLKVLLESNNWQAQGFFLGDKKEFPEDGDLLVVAGPQRALSPHEEEVVQKYLDQGGEALFLIESTPVGDEDHALTEEEKKKNPSLNSLLNPWGLSIGDDVVVDLTNHVSGDAGCPATNNYPPHKAIVHGLDYTFYVRPRSVSFISPSRATIKTSPLVLTLSATNSWAETDKTLKVVYDEGVDLRGPVPLAAVIWEPQEDKKKSDTRFIVITDADFLTNDFITSYSNASFLINGIRWLTDLPDVPITKVGEVKVHQLDLTSQQLKEVAIILILMPILIAGWGIGVWIRYNA